MTNRLAISMLLTVWAILIAAGVTAYVTTRSVVLKSIDDALVARARPLGEGGRFVVKDDLRRTMQSGAIPSSAEAPEVLRAAFVTLGDGQRVRSVTVRVRAQDDDAGERVTVTLSEPADAFDRLMRRLAWALVITGCVGGVIAAFVARVVAGLTLRPLRGTAETIGAIDEHNLSRRIDVSKLAPELLPVGERLNDMLARLETSFANRKQFLADASHELRTPVAAMVTTLEVSLRRLRDADAYRQTMQTCLADAKLMRKLVESLMAQARSEIGAFDEESVLTHVGALLMECADILKATAEQKGVAIACSIDDSITQTLPPGRLHAAVMGLLENAIDHNRPGGQVEVSAAIEGGQLRIRVRDTGPGIAPEHLPRLFEPFYRASRSRDIAGHMGLGLYLVKSHITAMGGTCMVQSDLGAGSTFQIGLPVVKKLEMPLQKAVVSQN